MDGGELTQVLVEFGEDLCRSGRVRSAALAFEASLKTDEALRMSPRAQARIRLRAADYMLKFCSVDDVSLGRIAHNLEKAEILVNGLEHSLAKDWLILKGLQVQTYSRLQLHGKGMRATTDALTGLNVISSAIGPSEARKWIFYFRFKAVELSRDSGDYKGARKFIEENIAAARTLKDTVLLAACLLVRAQYCMGITPMEEDEVLEGLREVDLVLRGLAKQPGDDARNPATQMLRSCADVLRTFMDIRLGQLAGVDRRLRRIVENARILGDHQAEPTWQWLPSHVIYYIASHFKYLTGAASESNERSSALDPLPKELLTQDFEIDNVQKLFQPMGEGRDDDEYFHLSPRALTSLAAMLLEGRARFHLSKCNFAKAEDCIGAVENVVHEGFAEVPSTLHQLKGELAALGGGLSDKARNAFLQAKNLSGESSDVRMLADAYLALFRKNASDNIRFERTRGTESGVESQRERNPLVKATASLLHAAGCLHRGFQESAQTRKALRECLSLICFECKGALSYQSKQISSNALWLLSQFYLCLIGNTSESQNWTRTAIEMSRETQDLHSEQKTVQLKMDLHKRARELDAYEQARKQKELVEVEYKRRRKEAY
ncbi:hypothetical protein NDN08_006874 [Rhodosorus marinus]|uniref:KIF-binding protein n=1 Tax=Rhodosorus marinus TaxID=101924 RepID=A0AAV8UIX2_9RHOD|nr:hypothetical protein NDN08_006874 [Rhodosorus marinus]